MEEAQKQRMKQLNELEEIRQDVVQRTILIQNHRVKWHDKFLKQKVFRKVTRLYCLIRDLKTSKVNLQPDGWDHMKS